MLTQSPRPHHETAAPATHFVTYGHMWVPDLGLALRVCPGMTPSSGADCSAPGISPCPLRGSRPTQGRLNVPRLVGIARHPTRAMRQAVLNPVRNTCFVTGCSAGDERVGGRWCLCGSCVRWPADLLEPLPHVRGEVPQTDHHPPPHRGETGILSWLVVLRYGVSRLFTGGAGRRRLFRAFLLFSGFLCM